MNGEFIFPIGIKSMEQVCGFGLEGWATREVKGSSNQSGSFPIRVP